MPDLVVTSTPHVFTLTLTDRNRRKLTRLALELVELAENPETPRGVFCATWLRLGMLLGNVPKENLTPQALMRLTVESC